MVGRQSLPIVNGADDDDNMSIHVHQRIGPSRPLHRETPTSPYNALFKQFLKGDLQTRVELEKLLELLYMPSSPDDDILFDEEEEEEVEAKESKEELEELEQNKDSEHEALHSRRRQEESSEDTLYDIPNKRFTVESIDNSRSNAESEIVEETQVPMTPVESKLASENPSRNITTKLSIWGWLALLLIIGVVIYVLDVLQSGNRLPVVDGTVASSWLSDLRRRQDFLEETLASNNEETNRRFELINEKFVATQETVLQIADKLKSFQEPDIIKNCVLNETVSVEELVARLESQVDVGNLKKEVTEQILQRLPIRYGINDKKLHYTKDFRKFVEELAKTSNAGSSDFDRESMKQAVKEYLQDEIPSNPKNLVMDSIVDVINSQQIKVNYADYGLGARVLGFLTNVKTGNGNVNSFLNVVSLKWLLNYRFNNQDANNVLLENDASFEVSSSLAIRLSHVVYLSDLVINLKPKPSPNAEPLSRVVIYVKPKKFKYFQQLLPHKLPKVPVESSRYLKRFIPIHTCRIANGINKIKMPRSLTHLQIPVRDIFLTFDTEVDVMNVRGYGLTVYEGEEFMEIGRDDILS